VGGIILKSSIENFERMSVFNLFKPDIEALIKEKDVLNLINVLENKDKGIRNKAIKGLAEIGETAVEPLIASVIYNDSIMRNAAAEALGEIGDHMVVIIRGGLIKFINSAVSRITGYSNFQVLNKQFTDFIAPEYEELVLERYKKRLMDEKVPNSYKVQLLSKTGDRISVVLKASRIKFEGRPADLVIIKPIA
jgi:PAS domain S-box-containing protein